MILLPLVLLLGDPPPDQPFQSVLPPPTLAPVPGRRHTPVMPDADIAHSERCRARAEHDAAGAERMARDWIAGGDNWRAQQCLGEALATAGDLKGASDALVRAAAMAVGEPGAIVAALHVQAANALIAAGQPADALDHLARAIDGGALPEREHGEAEIDRARAWVALDDYARARTALDTAERLVPADPLAWLLSATLARRMRDLTRARTDIAEASRLAPGDPDVAREQTNIAKLAADTGPSH